MSTVPYRRTRLSRAAMIFVLFATPAVSAPLCGDVNESSSVTSSDALAVLRKAVGQPLVLDCPDYINRYGEPEDTHKSSNFEKDYLLGQKVTIEHAATLTHFGFIARAAGTTIRFGLYSDVSGAPGNLLASTITATVRLGSQEIPVNHVQLTPGDYWIMGNLDSDTLMAADENAAAGPLIYYRDLPFGDPMPATFGVGESYSETLINYWVKVEQ